MATNRNLINVLGLLVSLALVNNPVIVSGQGLLVSGLFPFRDSYYDVGNKAFLTKALVPATLDRTENLEMNPTASFLMAMDLGQQVLKVRELKLKSNWNNTFLSQSLSMFCIGSEDYLNFTKSNLDADAFAQEAFVTSVTNRLKQDILRLYLLGARKFSFHLLPPLGCLPIVRQDYKTGDQCYEKLNDLAKLHNGKIGPMMDGLAKQYPGFQYNLFDFYYALLRRITRNMNYRKLLLLFSQIIRWSYLRCLRFELLVYPPNMAMLEEWPKEKPVDVASM